MPADPLPAAEPVLTIGHSNRPLDQFWQLLLENGVTWSRTWAGYWTEAIALVIKGYTVG